MTGILITDFVIVLFILLRVLAAFIASPIFGHRAIPVITKIFLSFIIAYIVFLSIHKPEISSNITIWYLFVNSVKEIITGLIMGFMLNFVFYGISYSGSLVGFDMGLAMSQVFNPGDETSSNDLGQMLYIAAILVFFLINGHHYVIKGLIYSFSVIPIGKFTVNHSVFNLMVTYSAAVFVIAVKIAAPIMVSFFLIHIAEGILARVIPQMQVFFVTQPLKIGLGFLMLVVATPIYVYVIKGLLREFENNLFTLIKAMGT